MKIQGKRDLTLFKWTGNNLACFVLPLPSCGFILCVLLSLYYDFEGSTSTHCRVSNYLPSVSAAIGGEPQRYIWRVFIALQCAPRLMIATVFGNFFKTFYVKNYRRLYDILSIGITVLHLIENLCLLGLTNVSSKDNFAIHRNCFVGFIVCSQVYMLLTIVMYKWAHEECGMKGYELKSYKLKCNVVTFNIGVLVFAVYVYWRHNTYCEPGMYTVFCFCEYCVIASNIAFHATHLPIHRQNFHLLAVVTKDFLSDSTEYCDRNTVMFRDGGHVANYKSDYSVVKIS